MEELNKELRKAKSHIIIFIFLTINQLLSIETLR